MSTTAMMSNHYRRYLTPVAVGPSNKRKERDGFDVHKPSKLARPSIPRPGPTSPPTTPKPKPPPEPPALSNQLLAGYLAHEFLTKGTLLGQPWDPARAEAVTVSAASPTRLKPSSSILKAKAEVASRAEPKTEKYQRYVEVTDLLTTDGAHLPGIVNPAQLARFLQL